MSASSHSGLGLPETHLSTFFAAIERGEGEVFVDSDGYFMSSLAKATINLTLAIGAADKKWLSTHSELFASQLLLIEEVATATSETRFDGWFNDAGTITKAPTSPESAQAISPLFAYILNLYTNESRPLYHASNSLSRGLPSSDFPAKDQKLIFWHSLLTNAIPFLLENDHYKEPLYRNIFKLRLPLAKHLDKQHRNLWLVKTRTITSTSETDRWYADGDTGACLKFSSAAGIPTLNITQLSESPVEAEHLIRTGQVFRLLAKKELIAGQAEYHVEVVDDALDTSLDVSARDGAYALKLVELESHRLYSKPYELAHHEFIESTSGTRVNRPVHCYVTAARQAHSLRAVLKACSEGATDPGFKAYCTQLLTRSRHGEDSAEVSELKAMIHFSMTGRRSEQSRSDDVEAHEHDLAAGAQNYVDFAQTTLLVSPDKIERNAAVIRNRCNLKFEADYPEGMYQCWLLSLAHDADLSRVYGASAYRTTTHEKYVPGVVSSTAMGRIIEKFKQLQLRTGEGADIRQSVFMLANEHPSICADVLKMKVDWNTRFMSRSLWKILNTETPKKRLEAWIQLTSGKTMCRQMSSPVELTPEDELTFLVDHYLESYEATTLESIAELLTHEAFKDNAFPMFRGLPLLLHFKQTCCIELTDDLTKLFQNHAQSVLKGMPEDEMEKFYAQTMLQQSIDYLLTNQEGNPAISGQLCSVLHGKSHSIHNFLLLDIKEKSTSYPSEFYEYSKFDSIQGVCIDALNYLQKSEQFELLFNRFRALDNYFKSQKYSEVRLPTEFFNTDWLDHLESDQCAELEILKSVFTRRIIALKTSLEEKPGNTCVVRELLREAPKCAAGAAAHPNS